MDALSILREQWESLLDTLPRGFDLEKTLRQSGGLVRRREIRSAESLLRLMLVYSLCGLSLRSTAEWAQAHGVAEVSDVALLKRLRKAAPWVGQLLGAKLAERTGEKPRPIAYRLRLAGARPAPGRGRAGWGAGEG